MKPLWENCLEYCQTDEAKRNLKQCLLQPLGDILYQEFYIYVWIICLYHIFLILMVFGSLGVLTNIYRHQSKFTTTSSFTTS